MHTFSSSGKPSVLKVLVPFVITLLVAAVTVTGTPPPSRLHGVPPRDKSLFQREYIECPPTTPAAGTTGAHTRRVPIARVNDDYCDCGDGKDEPGTSACAGRSDAVFYCRNAGSAPQEMPTSRVNDGICDCCDGTDEYAGDLIQCPNTCAAQGAAERAQLESRRRAVASGVETRQRYAAQGKRMLSEVRRDLNSVRTELNAARKERDVLEKEKDRIERLEGLKEKEEELQNEEEGKEENDEGNQEDNPSDEDKDKDNDAGSSAPPEPSPGILSSIHPVYRHVYRAVFSIYVGAVRMVYGDFNKTEAEKIREQYDQAENKVRELERKEKDLREKDEQDWGPDSRFAALDGQCFTIDTAEYVYEMCSYGKATQKPKKGSNVNLGKFDGFSDNYSKMLFKNGASCWKGPKRSLTVVLECGDKEKVLSILEPSKCIYEMTFATPAACEASELKDIDAKLKQYY